MTAAAHSTPATLPEMFWYDQRQSPSVKLGTLALENGSWLALPPGFHVDAPQFQSRDIALRTAIAQIIRKARRYMRNAEGQGTHWTEGYAGRVIEWALSLKPEKNLDQGAAAIAAPRDGHPGALQTCANSQTDTNACLEVTEEINLPPNSASDLGAKQASEEVTHDAAGDTDAGVTDDRSGDHSGAVIQSKPTDPIVAALVAAHRARKKYPAGHTFSMTNPQINGKQVSMGTCTCGENFTYPWGAHYELMDAAIEAHWQKFDHLAEKVDGRGIPIGTHLTGETPSADDKKPKRQTKSRPGAGGPPPAPIEPAPSPSPDGAGSLQIQDAQICAATDEYLAGTMARTRSVDDLGSVQDALKMSSDGPSSPGLVGEDQHVDPNSPATDDDSSGLRDMPSKSDPFWDSPLIKAALDLAWKDEAPATVEYLDDLDDDIAPDPLPMPTAEELKALSSANVRILIGDCRALMKTLPANSIQCVVTSPPYWGLRDYGIEPSIWGGSEDCAHEWGDAVRAANANNVPGPNGLYGKNGNGHRNKEAGAHCIHCDAWRGAFGLEPDYQMFVEHAVEIFREVKRVLRPDGTVWLNIGDSYATGAGRVRASPGGGEQGERWRGGHEGEHGPSWFDRPSLGESSQFADRKVSGIGPMTQPNRMPQVGLKSKDLCGIPWRVAFALQSDGWWLRQDVIWSKPNPMPESTRDRCTKAHEYIFLLSKSERYFYDADAIAEEASPNTHDRGNVSAAADGRKFAPNGSGTKNNGSFDAAMAIMPEFRNKRSVWEVATQPFPEAHFATFPPALIEPCVLASTSARGCCVNCGTGWQRVTRKVETGKMQKMPDGMATYAGGHTAIHKDGREKGAAGNAVMAAETIGWYPLCKCEGLPALPSYPAKPSRTKLADEAAYKRALSDHRLICVEVDAARAKLCAEVADRETLPAMVFDPFGGAGTTGLVADRLKRKAILTERNPAYAAIASKRIRSDAGIFASVEQVEAVDTPPSLLDVMGSEP